MERGIWIIISLWMALLISIEKVCSQESSQHHVLCSNITSLTCERSYIVITDVTNDRVVTNHTALSHVRNKCKGQSSCQVSSKVCPPSGNLKVHFKCVDETESLLGHMKKPSLVDILIILLSIVSGISIVLFVILIVFCIRWRSLQLQGSEPLYNYQDISPGLQAHYEYISSLEPELDKNRPELVDGYFEVADALPVQERGATPTSPAYAEVEQVAQMRRLIFLDEPQSSHRDSIDGTYSLVAPDTGKDGIKASDSESKEPGSQSSSVIDIPSNSAGGRPKRTVLDRLKGVPGIAFGDRDKKLTPQGDVSPKIYSTRNGNGQSARSLLKGKTNGPSTTRQKIGRLFGSREDVASKDIPDTTSEAGSEPAYEIVEEFVPLSVSKLNNKAKLKPGGEQALPALPNTGPPSDSKQKKTNQKASNKKQDIPSPNHVYANPASPSLSQKRHLDPKVEKSPGDKKDRANIFMNQKSKVASPLGIDGTKPAKPKSAKTSSVIPPNNGRHAALGKQQGPSTTLTASASPSKPSLGAKADTKKKDGSSLSAPDTSGTKNNNYKPTVLKDIPRSKGIVKNGIQRFEQSSTASNE